MFQKLVVLAMVFSATVASAKELSLQDLRERVELRAEVYRVNGKRIVEGPMRTNSWRLDPEKGSTSGSWSSNFGTGQVAIRQTTTLNPDGTLKLNIEEFAEADRDGNFAKSLAKQEYNLDGLEPVIWKVKNLKDQQLVVRFIPSIRDVEAAANIDNLPIAAKGIVITDTNGYLWTDGNDLSGKFIGVTTHRGTIALSFAPFKGSKEMGVAEGHEIRLKVDGKYQISLRADTSFLPEGMVGKIYAVYQPNKKSKGISSVHSFSSSTEDRIQEVLNK